MTEASWTTLREDVYSGGTLAAREGEQISPDRAYALGVNEDGTLDRTLSTDQLRERALSAAAPVPAEGLPADAAGITGGEGEATGDQATGTFVTGDGSGQALPPYDPEGSTSSTGTVTGTASVAGPGEPGTKAARTRKP